MEGEATAATLSTIVEAIGTVFEGGMDMAATVGTTVVGNPLLLFGAVISFVGLGIGIFARLLHMRS